MLKRFPTFIVFLLLIPKVVVADGRVIAAKAYPKIVVPDQRALINFASGQETLIIETSFVGEGTDFAWAVPTPSVPKIEEASSGLFTTLQFLFRPRLIHEIPSLYLVIPLVALYLYLFWKRPVPMACFGALLCVMVLPASNKSRFMAGATATTAPRVSILDRNIVGIYETTTIAAKDPNALLTWLDKNGYSISTNLLPAVTEYLKENWVFVAAKVRRDIAGVSTSSPHPLAFTFRTDKPVYPLRLTGIDNGSCRIELYVFGPGRAETARFKVERCEQPKFPAESEEIFRNENDLRIRHPQLRKFVGPAPVATKLKATLSPSEMAKDAYISWTPFRSVKHVVVSEHAADALAANIASFLLVGGLSAAGFAHRLNWISGKPLRRWLVLSVCAPFLVGALVLWMLPKVEIQLQTHGSIGLINLQKINALAVWMLNDDYTFEPGDLKLTTDLARMELPKYGFATNQINYYTGQRLREEDSPGSYQLREAGGKIKYFWFDADGAPHDGSKEWKWRE